VKALYTEHPDVARMSEAEVAAFLSKRCIAVDGASARPVTSFDQTGLSVRFEPPVFGHQVARGPLCVARADRGLFDCRKGPDVAGFSSQF
jgi:hypothetical protein